MTDKDRGPCVRVEKNGTQDGTLWDVTGKIRWIGGGHHNTSQTRGQRYKPAYYYFFIFIDI